MKAFAYGIALAGLVLVGRSAAADSSLDRVRACMPQPNDAARLACYDKELGRTATAPAPGATTPTTAARANTATTASTAVSPVKAAPAVATLAKAAPAVVPSPATSPAKEVTAAPAVAPPPPMPAKPADFGMTPELLHKQQLQAGIKPAPPPPESLAARVAKIGTYGNGLLVVTLDNGQVWQQQESGDAHLAVGDAVKISRGMFGALWMDDASHRRTSVKRIQ